MNAADTPMWRQYRELKAREPDALLFFRLGDFYELFGEDAVWTAAALELTLTSRNKDDPEPMPMCGVPYHAADGYLRRLLELGKKVAIAEQVEDPRAAKGIVKRDIVRVVTPGLAADLVDAHEPAFLVALGGGPGAYGVAFLDASTGELRATQVAALDAVLGEVARHEPREALLAPEMDEPELRAALGAICIGVEADFSVDAAELSRRFPGHAAAGEAALGAASALVRYAARTLRAELGNLTRFVVYAPDTAMGLDEATRRNLELFRPLRGPGRKGTLVGLVDRCPTAMGGRLVRAWVGAPSLDLTELRTRHDAVEAFVRSGPDRVKAILHPVADVERIAARIAQGTANARDLAALRDSIRALPALVPLLDVPALAALLPADRLGDVGDDIAAWLVDDPPIATTEGGLLRPGADPELDRLRSLALDAKGAIAQMETDIRAKTGIASVRIKHNDVFGYFIEVTKANLEKVEGLGWHVKQTVSTGQRYITPELKEYEEAVHGADEKATALEYRRFVELRERVAVHVPRLQATAHALARIDVLSTFAAIAVDARWVRPTLDETGDIEVVAGRHPVVESVRREERFVPNDTTLGRERALLLLTGPNMAGKSTLMRQVALIVLLAQIGSFVPATRARLGLVDRLFVRVGASDDLVRGQSTFMVEMTETSNILANATSRSLVLLDEIGRGTATYDGLAIAWAVAEDLHDRVRCRAIFATHYHELAALAETHPRVRNQHVAIAETGDRIVFLRKVKDGPAPGSYGIQCARLAGLPLPVVQRAKQLLTQLEKRRPKAEATQLSLFGERSAPPVDTPRDDAPLVDAVRATLDGIDPDALSPREALDALYRLKRVASET